MRVKKVLERLRGIGENIGALLVTDENNIRYICGFSCKESALLVLKKGKGIFLTDARSYEEAKKRISKGISALCITRLTGDSFKKLIAKLSIKELGVEEDNITLALYKGLRKLLGGVKLIPTNDIVEDLRSAKDKKEIQIIRKNARLTKRIWRKVIAKVKPGRKESDIARLIEEFVRKENAKLAFEPIVASGPNSAKPHAITSSRRIGKNDVVLIDFGILKDGYNTDITRVVFIGAKPNKKLKEIYEDAMKIQEMAIRDIKPGALFSGISKKVNTYLDRKSLRKFFLHGLGHGIGFDVHEEPFLSRQSNFRILEGMVFTVEPGLYIRGSGGVRIEDMVLVTKKGVEVLTR